MAATVHQTLQSIEAMQIFDSRGNPTVKVKLVTDRGIFTAEVPSGASTGSHEAHELRDNDPGAYAGKGVSKAVEAVNKVIGPALIRSGLLLTDQRGIDQLMIGLDGTEDKRKLGANAILGVSMACCRAGAAHMGLELFEYISYTAGLDGYKNRFYVLPVPCTNQINGGVHSGNGLAPQEFMILPVGATSFEEAMKIVTECYHSLKAVIADKFGKSGTGIGDEGGFAPPISSAEEALDLLVEAVKTAGHTATVCFAVDPASSEFYLDGSYDLDFKAGGPKREHRVLSSDQLGALYSRLLDKYPLVLLEDPFAEDDWESWTKFLIKVGKDVELVGDDLLCTNQNRMRTAQSVSACNSLLLKINQIGSLTEAMDAALLAYEYGWSVFVSHRSGETIDDFIADLVVGLQTGHIKSGAPCRGERLAKYNRLLEIELNLKSRGIKHEYASQNFRLAHKLR